MAFTLLGRLLDIEWMLLRDEERTSVELIRHDRELLGARAASDPEQALGLWLDGRRRELDERTLGVRVSELLTALHVALVIMAGVAGAGTAGALLRSPAAREPTNVLHFLFATLVWPMALLVGSVLVFLVRGRLGRSVVLEDVYIRMLGVLGRVTRRRAHEGWDLGREWRKLRRVGRRYRDLEVGTLASAAQWYPLSFHLGAAFSLFGSAVFSELAFAWSTTQDSLGWDTLAGLFRTVTAPWCMTLDVGCVTPELVRATQFSRFTGRYALPEGAAMSGAWWTALLFCLLAYGTLPRLGFALGLRAFVAQRSARLSERVLELRGRLRQGVNVIAHPAHPEPDGALPAPPLLQRPPPGLPKAGTCWLIRWRGAELGDDDVAALCARLGLDPVRRDAAGGSDVNDDDALLETARQGAGRDTDAVLLLVEGWEAPDKATRRFVQALRQKGASDRPIFVCVLLPAENAPELSLWRDRLRLLEDPFVSVQPHVPSRDPARPSPEGLR
jgi:hypothetical protein